MLPVSPRVCEVITDVSVVDFTAVVCGVRVLDEDGDSDGCPVTPNRRLFHPHGVNVPLASVDSRANLEHELN